MDSPFAKLALDLGPIVVFFAANLLVPGDPLRKVLSATLAFMVATAVAMIVARLRHGRVSPLLLVSGVMVLVFGGLTIWFHDQRFIQMKPTFVYAILAALLGFGLATGRPVLEQLLGSAYPGLTAAGWRRLTVNWTALFLALAVANEIARATLSYDHWVLFKFPGCVVATLAFAVANVPMLLRHGLQSGGAAIGNLPPD